MRLTDSGSRAVMILVFLFCGEILKGGSQSPSSSPSPETMETFLVWDDMEMDFSNPFGTHSRTARVIVVDKNGHGDSVTVQGAVDMVPEYNSIRHKIYIRPGIYSEKVYVPKSKPFISFIGQKHKGKQTVIRWHDKASDRDEHGNVLGTFRTASVTVESDYFCASYITFQNTVVSLPWTYNMQAVALRLNGDKAWLRQVRILGTQDTLLDESGHHFFDHCFIQGTVDFICGNAKSLYRACTLKSVAVTTGAITAHHRQSPEEDTGFSFVKCNITGRGRVYLGRAWGSYARVTYSYCNFNNIVAPLGWHDWGIPARHRTVEFGEFKCKGEGANRSHRVPWSRSYTFPEVKYSLTTQFIDGRTWLDPAATKLFENDHGR